MVIKSSNTYHILVFLMFCFIPVFFFFILGISGSKAFLIIAAVLLYTLVIRFWITVGRILIMDENGCTVQFLWYRRRYKWADIEVKKLENYTSSNRLGYRQPYTTSAFFCCKKIKKPLWIMPAEYSMLVHPFCFFFVYFDSNIQYKKWDYQCPDIYVVNEEKFKKSMAEWNIELL